MDDKLKREQKIALDKKKKEEETARRAAAKAKKDASYIKIGVDPDSKSGKVS